MGMGSSRGATATRACAILLWSTLATLAVLARPIPPLEMTAIAFAIGGAAIAAGAVLRGRAGRIRPTVASLLLGVYGLFGYHALYFAALRLAPPAEAQ
jgi:drug/metabolite transporter (DMT)-like permease